MRLILMSRRASILLLAGMAVGLALVFRALMSGPGNYTAENLSILDAVEPYPSARQVRTSTRPYEDSGWLGSSTQHVTDSTFKLPQPVSDAQLHAHFRRALGRNWADVDESDCKAFVRVRDNAVFLVAADVFDPRFVHIMVDVHGRDSCEAYMAVLAS